MQTVKFQILTSIEVLRESQYHQQLGGKLCAAYVAQQQGIKMDTAFKKLEPPIGDLWLLMAEIMRQQCTSERGSAETGTIQ